MRLSRRDLGLVLGLTLAYTWFDHYGTTFLPANEGIRLYLTQAIVDDRTLALDAVLRRHRVRNIDRAEYGGHVYLDKAPGLSLAAVPVYATLTRLGMPGDRDHLPFHLTLLTSFLVALPCAFGCLAVRATVRRLGGSELAGMAAALALGLATPYAIYATLFFGHGPAAALAAGCLWASVSGRSLRAGAFAGAMVLVETQTAPLALVLLWPTFRLGWRESARAGLAALPFAAIQCAYNTALFGSPFEFAYAHKATSVFQAVHASGFLGVGLPKGDAMFGLLASAHRGILFHAPVVLGAGAAITARAARFPLAAFGVHFLVIAGFSDWPAGDAWGPRHLVPALPALAVAVGLGLDRLGHWARVLLAILAGVSYVGAWLPIATFPYAMAAVDNPLGQIGWPLAASLQFAADVVGYPPASALLGLALPLVLALWLPTRRTWLVPAAAGAALLVVYLGFVSPAEGEGARARDMTDCLMKHEDAARSRCEMAGGSWSARRCACTE